jgi:Metallo-beta-lactamase superfamily
MFALHLLDVGQGEAILLDLPGRRFALIDGGPRPDANGVIEEVEQRISEGWEFRFAAVSHWDADHIAGLSQVIRRFPPEEFIQPGIDLTLLERLCERFGRGEVSSAIISLRAACEETGINELGLSARQSVRDVGEGIEVYALSPNFVVKRRVESEVTSTNLPAVLSFRRLHNQASLALWVRAYGRNLLLAGEVGRDEVLAMRQQFSPYCRSGAVPFDDFSAIWIKLPHHGSKTNACSELFQFFAAPQFVASASHGARWSHPHPEVLRLVHFGGPKQNSGSAMCTRLGKGCSLIRAERGRYPPDRPEEWARDVDWNEIPNPHRTCYGTITVQIAPNGTCTIRGAADEDVDCPYGGPSRGFLELPTQLA